MKVSSTVISNTKCGSFFNNVDESNICIMGDASVNICGVIHYLLHLDDDEYVISNKVSIIFRATVGAL